MVIPKTDTIFFDLEAIQWKREINFDELGILE